MYRPKYQDGVRGVALGAAVACLVGCSPQPGPAPQSGPAGKSGAAQRTAGPDVGALNPANIKRLRSALPPDYEVAEVRGPTSVAAQWGFGAGWIVEPAECAKLVDPSPSDPAAQGFSASGPGGIVYVIVSPHRQNDLGAVLDECGHWTMTFGHTTGTFELTDAPTVDGADTVAVTGLTRTAVESGTETHTQINAAYAYLGDYVVEISLITDPGSGHHPLDSGFVTELVGKATVELRG
jgi:hypothetical protein